MIEAQPSPTIDRMLSEIRNLLESTRAVLFEMQEVLDALPLDQRLLAVRECSRLTGRLTAVLSWLLAQKAVINGEFASNDERVVRKLFGTENDQTAPLLGDPPAAWALPFASIIEDSNDLYSRAARLDKAIRQKRKDARNGRHTP